MARDLRPTSTSVHDAQLSVDRNIPTSVPANSIDPIIVRNRTVPPSGEFTCSHWALPGPAPKINNNRTPAILAPWVIAGRRFFIVRYYDKDSDNGDHAQYKRTCFINPDYYPNYSG